MYCRYCGKTIADDSVFCTYCGKLTSSPFDGNCTGETNSSTYNNNKTKRNVMARHGPLIVKTLCYIALGVFLIFNIKMAPFYGWWKFLAYIVEAVIAICLTNLVKNNISQRSSWVAKSFVVLVSMVVITSSIFLRILYDSKVERVEYDVPNSGAILIEISEDTDYYSRSYFSYSGGLVYDPSTSVLINGTTHSTQIEMGQPLQLEVTVEGNGKSASANDTISLYATDFKNGKYTLIKEMYLKDGISAEVTITIRRYCTFWDVILY